MYKHFIRLNASNDVIAAFSSAFREPEEGDICVAETESRHFNPRLKAGEVYRYTWDGANLIEKTEEEIENDPSSVETLKESLCAKVEILKDTLMRRGFPYKGGIIQADAEAQSNLSAWVLMELRGVMTYSPPRRWRRLDNSFLEISGPDELSELATAMAAYKDSVYSSIFEVKDAIRASSSTPEATLLYDDWLEGTNQVEVNA